MTKKEKIQFNQMHEALRKISKDYQTPQQLLKDSEKQYGLDYGDAIEMSYENMQGVASYAIKGIRKRIIN